MAKRLNEMEGVSCLTPEGAFYAFPNIKELGMSSSECTMWLLERARISSVPGSGFGPYGEGYLRLSFATSINNIEEAMNRIETALARTRLGIR